MDDEGYLSSPSSCRGSGDLTVWHLLANTEHVLAMGFLV
jgi:hypothetical protein